MMCAVCMHTCLLSCRSRQQVIPQALAGGGAGSIRSDKGSGVGGGGGWGGDGAGKDGGGAVDPPSGG
jgi:hypothetical protein